MAQTSEEDLPPAGSTAAEQDAVLKKQVAQFRPIIRELDVTID